MSDNETRMSAELRGGCAHHRKRWSGDTHADLGGPVNEAGTEALMSAAADTIDRLTADAASLRERMIELERQRDDYLSREWRAEKAKRKAEAERDAAVADAMRYRWLCDGNGYFMEHEMLCGHGNEKAKADATIDKAIAEHQS